MIHQSNRSGDIKNEKRGFWIRIEVISQWSFDVKDHPQEAPEGGNNNNNQQHHFGRHPPGNYHGYGNLMIRWFTYTEIVIFHGKLLVYWNLVYPL